MEDSKDYLIKAGFEEFVLTDFQELLLEKLKIVGKEDATMDDVVSIFLEKNTSHSLVMYLRFITSGYLKTNAILYENYIIGYNGIDHYC